MLTCRETPETASVCAKRVHAYGSKVHKIALALSWHPGCRLEKANPGFCMLSLRSSSAVASLFTIAISVCTNLSAACRGGGAIAVGGVQGSETRGETGVACGVHSGSRICTQKPQSKISIHMTSFKMV